MTQATRVIFRKWQGGDIIALFPYECGDSSPATCSSYMQVGQHGAADPRHVVEITKPAKPSEFESLRSELERLGYRLNVGRAVPRNAFDVRRDQLKRG